MNAKRKFLLYIFAAALICITSLYAYLTFSNDPLQFWKKVSGVQGRIDGRLVNVRLYRRLSGKLLIDFGENKGVYVYFPEMQNVGTCNSIRGISIPGYLYAKDYDDDSCPCILMGTPKTEVEARVVIEQNRLEFTMLDERRAEIIW